MPTPHSPTAVNITAEMKADDPPRKSSAPGPAGSSARKSDPNSPESWGPGDVIDKSRTQPQPAPPNHEIAKLDQELSADLDHMLQGNFESIDTVLDGVFEEQAVLVQNPGGPAIAPSRPAQQQAQPFQPPPDPIVPTDPSPADAALRDSSAAIPSAAADGKSFPADEPLPKSLDSFDSSSIPPAFPAEDFDVAAKTKSKAKNKTTGTGSRSFFLQLLIALSAPLRLLPPNFKPIINWMAVTLLLWVPIVWAMVAFAGDGKPHAPAAAATAEKSKHGEGEKSGHEEAKPKKEAAKSGHGEAKPKAEKKGH